MKRIVFGLLELALIGAFFIGCSSGQPNREYKLLNQSETRDELKIGDKMPIPPEARYNNSGFKTWRNPETNQRGVTIIQDLNKDKNYDIAYSYILCGVGILRGKFPYALFDRTGVYGDPKILYLDINPTDGEIDGKVENIGKKLTWEDAPECPQEA